MADVGDPACDMLVYPWLRKNKDEESSMGAALIPYRAQKRRSNTPRSLLDVDIIIFLAKKTYPIWCITHKAFYLRNGHKTGLPTARDTAEKQTPTK